VVPVLGLDLDAQATLDDMQTLRGQVTE